MLIYLVIPSWLAEFVECATYPSAANLRIQTFLIFKKTVHFHIWMLLVLPASI